MSAVTDGSPSARTWQVPRPSARWRPAFGFWLAAYRRTWRGSIVSRFLSPLFFLLSMGLGLGSLVDRSSGGVAGVPYLQFVVPGFLAAQAMFTAMGESTYQVLGAIKWTMQYHAMLATPLGVGDVLLGHLIYIAMQLLSASAIFVVVAALFGAWASWWVVLAIPLTVLAGLAFVVPIFAFSARQETDSGFNMLFRFVMTPLFLFSGVFFPVDQLPVVLRPIAWLTPLWHGVQIDRELALGAPDVLGILGHVAYLLLLVAIGGVLALRSFRARLVL